MKPADSAHVAQCSGATQEEASADRASDHLNRRSSAPARIKSGLQLELQVATEKSDARGCLDQSLDVDQTDARPHRHSFCDNSLECCRHHHHNSHSHSRPHHQHLTQLRHHHSHHCCRRHQHQSVSPLSNSSASSSASDSAFSQSQSTLRSSSSQSSLKHNCKRARQDVSRLEADSTDGGYDKDDFLANCCNRDQHFKIIWRNLKYQVPEKKFSKLGRFVSKLREKVWPESKPEDSTSSANEVEQKNFPGAVGVDIGVVPRDAAEQQQEGNSADYGQGEEEEVEEEAEAEDQPKNPVTRKTIFSNLNGCVRSGQLTAILGPSGAGKTTFLKCLTNSVVDGVSGEIDIVGGSATSHRLKLCIIPQKDYLFDNLTVMENLLFASRIKNTQGIDVDHVKNVHRVSRLLGLQSCLNLKTSRLSGGQYKRVSIAQELLSQPDILVLDEPTSGLDSLTCLRTVSVLRDLVSMSRAGVMAPLAIVMTIHQPQVKIFSLFHHVYVLSSMGRCVYEGKPDNLTDSVRATCQLTPNADEQNPASFIINLASEVYGTKPIEELTEAQLENFQLKFPKQNQTTSQNAAAIQCNKVFEQNFLHLDSKSSDIERQPEAESNLKISERLRKRNHHDNNFWLHTSLLVRRLWTSMRRDSLLTTTRVTFHFIIPFVFYIVYSQKSGAANACPYIERDLNIQDMVSDAGMQRLTTHHEELMLSFENVSLFFLLLYSFSMCVLAVTALSFPLNMQILLKETTNGWYTMPRFIMAKTIADLPIELTMPAVSVSIAYAITNQPSSYLCWRMLSVTAVMTLCSLISQTQGLLFGAFFMNNVQAAVFISQASTLPWVLLSGFVTRVSELPKVLEWVSFGSIYRLGIESIVALRYGYGTCPCDEETVNNKPAKLVGIPDQLKSVMQYYLETYSSEPSSSNANSTSPDMFDRIASTLSRANTFGTTVVTCDDVRPFIMTAREVDETTVPIYLLILLTVLTALRILLFFVVKVRAG